MSSAEITLLRFPDNVRLRKEMYLYSPNHCIQEIVDNSVDEFNAGRAKHINVKITDSPGQKFPVVSVADDGGGIPTSKSKDPDHKGETQAEVALGNLTAGGKFGTKDGYKTITSGLHGVGASCVNAVSNIFDATIYHNKTITILNYEKGILKSKAVEKPYGFSPETGTTITFALDDTLWGDESYDLDAMKKRLKQLSYLNPGLEIKYEYNGKAETYLHEAGLTEYYSDITSAKDMLNAEPINITKVVNDADVGDIHVNIVLGYSSGYSNDTYAFVNSVATSGGDHIIGLNQGVARAINVYYGDNVKYKNLIKNITADDCREGLLAFVSIKVMYPKFEGQSKNSVKMPQVRTAVYNSVVEELKLYLDQHPSFVKALAEKLERAAKSRIAAKRARDAMRQAKSAVESSLPGKLAACSSKKPEECSIYIVEGDSAAGSAIQGRDPKTQAILPVFGKILNSSKAREDEVLKSEKMIDVVKALKCGIGKTFDISKLRYHRIVIMADQDVDGFHISCLWITFFYTFLPELLRNGHIYIQLSPLYRVTEYIGKQEVNHYFFDDDELAKFSSKYKTSTSYIKGLGELQPKQLWESTMCPETRRLIQVTEADAENALKAIDICMGDNVNIRREFIMHCADFSKVVE